MVEIVTLGGRALDAEELAARADPAVPVAKIVNKLEMALDLALTGDLRAVIVIGLTRDSALAQMMVVCSPEQSFHMLGAIRAAEDRFIRQTLGDNS